MNGNQFNPRPSWPQSFTNQFQKAEREICKRRVLQLKNAQIEMKDFLRTKTAAIKMRSTDYKWTRPVAETAGACFQRCRLKKPGVSALRALLASPRPWA